MPPEQEERSEGLLWCPGCFCHQEFETAEDASQMEPYPAISCHACGYTFSKSKDEITGKSRPTVSEHVREMARSRLRAEFRHHLIASGVRVELLGGDPSK